MASIVLSTVGSVVGSAVGGPIGGFIGANLGKMAGGLIDNRVFGGGGASEVKGPRLSDLQVQTSTYGRMIPVVYGTVRIAGNIIWSRPIKETVTSSTSSSGGGKAGGGGAKQTTTAYSYSVSLAIAVCEGEISDVLRVWADAKPLNLNQGIYRVYKGTETQDIDAFIESFEGVGNTPAYRGLAYVVIEDFPLEAFGNRIPNFTFEVKRQLTTPDYEGETVEEMVQSIILIPGSGEFVYDTNVNYKVQGQLVEGVWVQQGEKERINMHNHKGIANAKLALDNLKETLPNVEWVGVVACWFGTSLDAGDCIIQPGVEYTTGATTEPDVWSVGGYSRATAHPITFVGDRPRYGGTPDDESLLRLIDELKGRGYSVMLYPMFFMDVENKPWRGHVTGTAAEVASFFTKTNGYNAFITHYANLAVGKVDAFVIGSELKGLTKVTDSPGNYPAVNALVSLAATVKSTLGSGVKVTYAADWSEYHHGDGGWYNLDPLWASASIDVIGIDAYFPLANEPQNGYDIHQAIDGWMEGEGYDFYFTDSERTTTAPLSSAYAWKDIAWWWSNTHTNPGGASTAWVPESKPIWFTEYGFPSVDGAINQPNVFYDPASSDGNFPYHSKGRMDVLAQRQGIAGTEAKWKDSTMVPRRFLWTWDARPFPFWPDRQDVWSDGDLWRYGHWVAGKLGQSSLAAIVRDICLRAGMADGFMDVTRLSHQVQGYVLDSSQTARQAIEQLMQAYAFDAVESDGVVKFIPRGQQAVETITQENMVPLAKEAGREVVQINRRQEVELPQKVSVLYYNAGAGYQIGTQLAQRMAGYASDARAAQFSIVMSDQQAKNLAESMLYSLWMQRTGYQFQLPLKYAALEPADVVEVVVNGVTHTIRLESIALGKPGVLRCQGVAEDISTYDFHAIPGELPPAVGESDVPVATRLTILDVPAFANDSPTSGILRMAGRGEEAGWRGGVIYRSDDGGVNYQRFSSVSDPAVTGTVIDTLPDGPSTVFDRTGSITVLLVGGELESVTELALLNGANICVVGNELLQFQTATFISPGKYVLTKLLRGRLGTEWAMASHSAGERFVLLDRRLAKEEVPAAFVGLPRHYKAVSVGATLGQAAEQGFSYAGRALRPYAPVHVSGERDGGGDVTIRWVRRARCGGEWRDYIDVPLMEALEAYDVEIMDGGTVVRTFSDVGQTHVLYSAAQQVTDFGSTQSSVAVRIAQRSAFIGRGYAATAVV